MIFLLHNLCGRARSGKTEAVCRIIGECIRQKKHVFFIVPEQSAVLYEREIIRRFGNESNMYVEVINFKRLCNRVFRETGGLTQSYVDPAHKLLLIAKSIELARPALTEYKNASGNTDFASKLLGTVEELRRFGVTSGALADSAALLSGKANDLRLSRKAEDLSLILSNYEQLLSDGYTDSSDDLIRLSEVLCDSHFFRSKTVVIDSFYGFTYPELCVLDRIVRDADDTYITYLYDEKEDSALFERSRKALAKIKAFAEDNFIGCENVSVSYGEAYKAKGIKQIEESFSDVQRREEENAGGVRILKCRDPFEECTMAAATVRYLVCEKGAKYSDIAITARNIEAYEGILDSELSLCGIPYGKNLKYGLSARPVAAFILTAFDALRSFSKDAVLRHVKTGLTLLSDEEADILECYVRTWNLQGKQFTREWCMPPDGFASDMPKERADEIVEKAEEARKKLITPLLVFGEDIRDAKTVNEISRAVLRLLKSGKYDAERLPEEEIVYHNMVMDALDCLCDVCGEEAVTPKRYAELFELILEQYDVGVIPRSADEVSIADVELFRSAGTKYMLVLGLCDGDFPRTPSEDSIFSDKERKALSEVGIELSADTLGMLEDEDFLAYKVMTAPGDGLFLFYTEEDAAGNPKFPSPLIDLASRLSGARCEEAEECPDIRLSLPDKSLKKDLFRIKSPALASAIRQYLTEKGVDLSAKDIGDTEYLSKECASLLFRRDMSVSPSRFDAFSACACRYFAQYTLGLSPEEEARLGAAEIGTVSHKILEDLVKELADKKRAGEEITEEYALRREHELLAAYRNFFLGDPDNGAVTKRAQYLYDRMKYALDACVKPIAKELGCSGFIPSDFELDIGGTEEGSVNCVKIPILAADGTSVGNLTVRGKIDRVDTYTEGGKTYLRVVDYKTGKKVFGLDRVAYGEYLQMLLYLYSLTENGSEKYGNTEIVPAGVLYRPVQRPEGKFELGEDGNISVKKTNGILIDDRAVLEAMEPGLCGEFIPAKANKDGSFSKASSVISSMDMERLLKTSAEVASKLAGEMKAGKIACNPIKSEKPQLDSCEYCDMAPFCRYEHGSRHTRYEMTKYSDEVFVTTPNKKGAEAPDKPEKKTAEGGN